MRILEGVCIIVISVWWILYSSIIFANIITDEQCSDIHKRISNEDANLRILDIVKGFSYSVGECVSHCFVNKNLFGKFLALIQVILSIQGYLFSMIWMFVIIIYILWKKIYNLGIKKS